MRTFERMICNKKYNFRLTVGAQKSLERKFGESASQLLLGSAADVEKMTYILGASASYTGNENPTTNGDEIYDLLVDDGVAGEDGFFDIAIKIAVASGIINEKYADKTVEAVKKMLEEAYDSLDPTTEASEAAER